MLGFLKQLFDYNERELRRLRPILEATNAQESKMKGFSDAELSGQTGRFLQELEQGRSLDDVLPEAYATVREAAARVLGQRHYDVQVLGGIALHRNMITEMRTGEGKTLAATLPAYLNALSGRGVHVVTVNEYLAERDREWMGEIYRFLGLEVGLILSDMDYEQRRQSYAADITYGTNNEFGFDYLRDNMAVSHEQLVQRELHYAIIDEVDSVLVDEARTPLIISGLPRQVAGEYQTLSRLVQSLRSEEDYVVDEKASNVVPTDQGLAKVEERLGVEDLFHPQHIELNHYLTQALKAKELMKRDRDYVLKDGRVIIVDQFTGRLMPGRRYSDGLHQALEAKEGFDIREETQTLASITFQNYFRMYEKLAGMTGTAATEADEFEEIYSLRVLEVPTNMPMIREDVPDAVYKTEAAKFRAVIQDIVERHQEGQPVLVGTASIERSERLSDELTRAGVPHEVLNAKHHEREAEIIKDAGICGRVTIATNMAGRGTDIVLGSGVTDLGGLHVLGTERHESRRIDNQLRGRSGRQGDPGSSQFYVSLEDDLMRLFGGEAMESMLDRLGLDEDERLEHSLLSGAIEKAQRRVESRNFSLRKQILEYDDVMNEQRKIIYQQRRRVLEGDTMRDNILGMMDEVVAERVHVYCSEGRYPETWDLDGLVVDLQNQLFPPNRITVEGLREKGEEGREHLLRHLQDVGRAAYRAKADQIGPERLEHIARVLLLKTVDAKWMDYLAAVDDLRQGIGLRAYGQRSPIQEYQRETHSMFQNLVHSIREDTVKYVFKLQVQAGDDASRVTISSGVQPLSTTHESRSAFAAHSETSTGSSEDSPTPFRRKDPKTGRNDPCPCGSGRKYKHCCGA